MGISSIMKSPLVQRAKRLAKGSQEPQAAKYSHSECYSLVPQRRPMVLCDEQ